ncbi:MAG TPA: hypothetical protein VF862_12480 [Gemmatimonadales bacterium]
MRLVAVVLLLAGACSEGTDPGTQYYSLSQAQAEAVAGVLVAGAAGPLLALVPQTVASGLIQLPVTASTDCPERGVTTLSGTIQGTASGGSASLLINVGESVSRCAFPLEGKTYEVNGVPVVSVGGFANYLDGVLLATQSLFLSGTVQVIGDQNAQAICPVDLTVTITSWSSPVRVQGNLCGRGIDQTVVV